MMKFIKPWRQLLYLLLFLLASCKEELNLPEPERSLVVQVVNNQNYPVPNADVSIYSSALDWKNEKNNFAKGLTDAKGNIHFSGIGADSVWIKVTWLDVVTMEVYQNTVISFEPISSLPANTQSFYQVKINSARVLRGIWIKKVEYSGFMYNYCDRYHSYRNEIDYCGSNYKLRDVSGENCDLYLLIDTSTPHSFPMVVDSYFFRSAVQVDVTGDKFTFEVNDTITDFRKPYHIGVREHLVLRPESYSGISCSNGYSTYSNLGDYLSSREGKEYVYNRIDDYRSTRALLHTVSKSIIPSYPIDEITIKLTTYDASTLKLTLEWVY